jgi:hypothetical protein
VVVLIVKTASNPSSKRYILGSEVEIHSEDIQEPTMVKRVKVNLPTERKNNETIAEPHDVPYEILAVSHLIIAGPERFVPDNDLKSKIRQGSIDLYRRLKPRNAQESIISLLAVGITNASLDCLALVSRLNVDQAELRDLNLRHGLKGATVAADLIKALNELRGEMPEKISVGNVNVEAGGQAIVGTVEASRSRRGRNKT